MKGTDEEFFFGRENGVDFHEKIKEKIIKNHDYTDPARLLASPPRLCYHVRQIFA